MKRHAAQTRLAEQRLSFERRSFDYSNHIPERRSGQDRRETPIAVLAARPPHPIQPDGNERFGALFNIVSGR